MIIAQSSKKVVLSPLFLLLLFLQHQLKRLFLPGVDFQFQYHGESFLGQSTSAGSPWLSSTTTTTLPTNSSNAFITDTGLSPPPSSNNSNVDETQVHTQLKPLHINNNIPIHPNTSGAVLTNTPTPPSSAEAISPSSVSSGMSSAAFLG